MRRKNCTGGIVFVIVNVLGARKFEPVATLVHTTGGVRLVADRSVRFPGH